MNKRNKTNIIFSLAIFALVFYSLYVTLKTGFISDDAYNSQIKGSIIQQGVTIHERIVSEIVGWVRGSGRFFVLNWYYIYGLYYWTQNALIEKLINVVLISLGVVFFYFFLKKETGNQKLAFLICLTLPLFFQLRNWHDPILAFTFLLPICFLTLISSLVIFQSYLETCRSKFLLASFVLYCCGLLMYEITIPMSILFFFVAYAKLSDFSKSLKKSGPFVISAIVLTLASFFFKWTLKSHNYLQSTYPGAELHLSSLDLIKASSVQLYSSFPLSYYFFNKEHLKPIFYSADWLLFPLLFFCFYRLIKELPDNAENSRSRYILFVGAVLFFVPAFLSALSGHQAEINQMGWGFGYITVYFQYFGLSILLGFLFVFMRKACIKKLTLFSLVMSAFLVICFALNLGLNRAVAMKTNEFYKYPRDLLQSSLQAGILDRAKNGDYLFSQGRFPSDYTWFYTTFTNKTFEVCELAQLEKYNECINKIEKMQLNDVTFRNKNGLSFVDFKSNHPWVISYNFDNHDGSGGRVVAAPIDSIVRNPETNGVIQIIVSSLRVYEKKTDEIVDLELKHDVNFLRILENQSQDYKNAGSLINDKTAAKDVEFDWSGQIYSRDGDDNQNVHWSSGKGTLNIHNLSSVNKSVTISMGLSTPVTEPSKLVLKSPNRIYVTTVDQTMKNYSEKIVLPPGKTMIDFKCDGKIYPNGDPRNIVFGIFNFKIEAN